MVYRILAGVTVCCVAVGAASLSSAGQAGQDPVAPRTPWGHPDLRGTRPAPHRAHRPSAHPRDVPCQPATRDDGWRF